MSSDPLALGISQVAYTGVYVSSRWLFFCSPFYKMTWHIGTGWILIHEQSSFRGTSPYFYMQWIMKCLHCHMQWFSWLHAEIRQINGHVIWSWSLFLYSKLGFLSFALLLHKFQFPSGLCFVLDFKNIIQNSTETFNSPMNTNYLFSTKHFGNPSMYKVGSLLAIKHAFCNRVDDTYSGNYKLQCQVVYEYEAPISPSSVGVYA